MLYSMITLYNSYIPLKLSFLGEARKGLLLTVSPAVSLLAPLLWGVLADRMTYRKRLLSALCILSSVFFLVICTNVSYPVLFSAILFYAFFSSSYGGLSDTLTLGYCNQYGLPYGRIRLMGTLGLSLIHIFPCTDHPCLDHKLYRLSQVQTSCPNNHLYAPFYFCCGIGRHDVLLSVALLWLC